MAWAKGGFFGVSVFFTLSGFLITSLVLTEKVRTGSVSPLAFWARRARRLIPASLAALLLALLVTAVAIPVAQRASAVGDIRSALFQFANWRFIQQGAHYAASGVVPSPVQAYWSLAIEEQFYLIFPLVALVTLRRRPALLAGFFTAVIALSIYQQVMLSSVEHIYYGTDARAAEIGVGGLLALAYPRLRQLPSLHRHRIPDLAGFAGLLAAVAVIREVPLQRAAIYEGGLAAFAIVSAMVVLGAVEGPLFRRLLGVRPLVALGRVSYGLYLYHFPIYLLLSEERVGFGGWGLLGVRATVAIGLASASYRWYELPIRRGVRVAAQKAPLFVLAGAAAVLLVGLPVARLGNDRQHLVFRPVGGAPTSSSSSSTANGSAGTTPETMVAALPPTKVPPARPPRVVVVGDSTAAANGAGLEAWGQATGRLQVVTVSEPGCGIIPGTKFTIREGYDFEPQRCEQLFPKAATAARDLDADAIVVFIGSSQLADWYYDGLIGPDHIGEPVVDARYQQRLQLVLGQLAAAGRPVLWATVPLPMWDLTVFSQMIGQPVPGKGPITLNDPLRTVRLNELNGIGVPQSPIATLWPYAARLAGPDGTVSKRLRPDGLHLSAAGVEQVAAAWMFDVLGRSYRTVEARGQSVGLVAPERQTWSIP